MDQELREYLDGFSKSVDARFESIDTRLVSMDTRFASMERQLQEFRAETARHFEQVDARLDTVETQIRHTNVVVEDLRGQIQLVAEGVATGNDRLDRLEQKMDRGFEEESSVDTNPRLLLPFPSLGSRQEGTEIGP